MNELNEVFDCDGNELRVGMKVIFRGAEVTIKDFLFSFPPKIIFNETILMALESEVKIPTEE